MNTIEHTEWRVVACTATGMRAWPANDEDDARNFLRWSRSGSRPVRIEQRTVTTTAWTTIEPGGS